MSHPLAIVCPSRNRPDLCLFMVRSALERSSCDVLIYLDSDDPTLGRYQLDVDPRVKVIVGPPIYRGPAVNHLIDVFRDYRAYLVVSDDIEFVRSGWEDEAIAELDRFGDDIGCVHLDAQDHTPYVNWAIVSRKWIDTLGWFNFPECRWFCQDTIIQTLAVALGRITRIEAQAIQHNIVYGYDVNERIQHDTVRFLWYMAKEFPSDLAKLRREIV